MHAARLGINSFIQLASFPTSSNRKSFLTDPFCRFNGTAPEPRKGVRGGHIPGSKCVPFTEVLTEITWFIQYLRDFSICLLMKRFVAV